MDETRKRPTGAWVVGALIAPLIAYPLSIGPIVWLGERNALPRSSGPVLNAFYRPMLGIMWWYDEGKLLGKYIEWWQR